jgi:hypothetical protein
VGVYERPRVPRRLLRSLVFVAVAAAVTAALFALR